MGRPPSPKKLQQGETSDWRDDPQEHDNIIPDPNTSRMKVDFPRWEKGDPIGWIMRARGTLFSVLPNRRCYEGGDCCHPPRGRCYSVV
ncbi:hypothetical protein B296_00053324 [Ensete ventricosum]|uniref:Uncharacterized protein n=1 Tax=Ensete ventricosum TaxID=4639 RepID=A0A426XBL3_ENSVE|nr:hypothetical protein B296_00053324 [Ensete ventricosum]